MPVSRGKQVFGLLEAKKGKETKQQKKNEEGLGPS